MKFLSHIKSQRSASHTVVKLNMVWTDIHAEMN